jgi:hypothetical protein
MSAAGAYVKPHRFEPEPNLACSPAGVVYGLVAVLDRAAPRRPMLRLFVSAVRLPSSAMPSSALGNVTDGCKHHRIRNLFGFTLLACACAFHAPKRRLRRLGSAAHRFSALLFAPHRGRPFVLVLREGIRSDRSPLEGDRDVEGLRRRRCVLGTGRDDVGRRENEAAAHTRHALMSDVRRQQRYGAPQRWLARQVLACQCSCNCFLDRKARETRRSATLPVISGALRRAGAFAAQSLALVPARARSVAGHAFAKLRNHQSQVAGIA